MAHHLKRRHGLRTGAAVVLVAFVVGVHWAVTGWMSAQLAAWESPAPALQRIQVAYVREMALATPVARPVIRPAGPKRRAAAGAPAPVDPAASSVPVADAEPPREPTTEDAPEVVQAAASAAEPAASTPDPLSTFEWPVSTRLRYELTGYVRGEVHGQAQVEWIRAGERYQVHLDVEVGPSFAPVAARRLSSEGGITHEGLVPQRYEQETRLGFGQPYRAAMQFDGERIRFAHGRTAPQLPGVQDTASQFVQIAYLFDREPERLRVGAVVEVLLAMPRNVSTWVYDVIGEELLHTPFGEVPSYHLRPRREPQPGGDLVTELWIAPRLRHLPVRFRIRQDAENHVDLMLDRRPELAASDTPSRNPP